MWVQELKPSGNVACWLQCLGPTAKVEGVGWLFPGFGTLGSLAADRRFRFRDFSKDVQLGVGGAACLLLSQLAEAARELWCVGPFSSMN